MSLVVIGLLLALPGLVLSGNPNSDGLFYEVQAKELEGESHDEAMHEVFSSDEARETASIEDESSRAYRVLNPAWQNYSAQFYERRWLVPGLAIAVGGVTGQDVPTALKTVSMLGYALIGAVLFLLLRRRFSTSVSVLGALACMLLPPLYRWSFGQFVDSWGVLLESLGLLALVLVCDRGQRWLPLWIGSMLLLSITRDATTILGLAAVWIAVAQLRDRATWPRNAWILVSGAAAALPALLLGGAPVRDNLALHLRRLQRPEPTPAGATSSPAIRASSRRRSKATSPTRPNAGPRACCFTRWWRCAWRRSCWSSCDAPAATPSGWPRTGRSSVA